MENYDRYYNRAFNRRNDDYGVYGSRDHDSNYYHEPDHGMRGSGRYDAYNRSADFRGGHRPSRDWREDEMRHREDDRNMFERAGDRIRDTWNDWTEGHRSQPDRYEWMNRDRTRDYHGNYYRADRDRGHDRNFFERAGDKVRNFFRAPDSENYREYDGPQDYGSRGYGNYNGNYGAYTGEHGLTGYNTGTGNIDNYSTDYDLHYREPGRNKGYRRDDVYSRRYGSEFPRRYDY